MTSPLDYALAYASFGYRVFPAAIFKPAGEDKFVKAPRSKKSGLVVPCAKHVEATALGQIKKCPDCQSNPGGHNAASSDERVVRRLWSGRMRSSAVAVLPPPGVLIVDDDAHVFDRVWLDHPRVETASGKSHYYFRLTDDQDALRSENQICYDPPDGLVDIRVGDWKRYVFAPCGQQHYRRRNGATLDPDRLRVLPEDVYARLLTAPRVGGGGPGGPGGGRHSPGVLAASVGNAYDRRPEEAERLLVLAGWEEADDGRWIRPGGTRPSAALNEIDGVCFLNVFSDGDPLLEANHYYTPSMLRCVFEFAGNWKQTYFALATEGAMTDMKEIFK